MIVSAIPRPRDVPVRVPVDHIGIGTMWAYLGLPRETAIGWAKADFDPHGALRVIAAYDEASFDIMEAALDVQTLQGLQASIATTEARSDPGLQPFRPRRGRTVGRIGAETVASPVRVAMRAVTDLYTI